MTSVFQNLMVIHVKSAPMKLLEEIGENFCERGLGRVFFKMTGKA